MVGLRPPTSRNVCRCVVYICLSSLGSEKANALSKIELNAAGIISQASSHLSFLESSSVYESRAGENAAKTTCANVSCSAFSDRPCCSSKGECGISDSHCKCSGCIDLRKAVGASAMDKWYADGWKNVCSEMALETSITMAVRERSLLPIRDACPSCHVGVFVTPANDLENIELSSLGLRDSKWGNCFMEWPEGQDGTNFAPSSVWRIDVLSTGSTKAPLVRWPCSTHGYPQLTGATVTTRAETARWARLLHSAQPDGFPVENVLDIGAGLGSSALHISLFTRGRTLALERHSENYQVLKFFAELNPTLGIETVHAAPAIMSSGSGRGKSDHFRSQAGVTMIDPYTFVEKKYGEDFIEKLGFVNLATDGTEASVLHELSPLLQHGLPAIHVAWNNESRAHCGINDTFIGGSHMLLTIVSDLGYIAPHPDSGEQIDVASGCEAFKYGPTSLLLLPAVVVDKLGKLLVRWNRGGSDVQQYLQPMLASS